MIFKCHHVVIEYDRDVLCSLFCVPLETTCHARGPWAASSVWVQLNSAHDIIDFDHNWTASI